MPAFRRKSRFSRIILVATLVTATALTLSAQSSTKASNPIDQVLRAAVNEKKIPGVVAMVAVADKVTYQGAFGKRDTTENIEMTADSIFRIASMTKPITSVAVMQLVESGRVKLDEPAATYFPELAHVQVFDGFDASTGKAKLRPPEARGAATAPFKTSAILQRWRRTLFDRKRLHEVCAHAAGRRKCRQQADPEI